MDSGQLPLARPLYEQARELAADSGDAVLAVHVLTNQSMLHAELARTGTSREPARQALRLAFQAQDEGRYLQVPRLHALIALRHASAASLLGDKASFQTAITQAHRELDRGPQDEKPPEWLRFVDHAEATGVEARGWLNLGDTAQSALLYRKVLTFRLSPRNRASYGAGLADALLRQGARQEAVAAAMDVLPAIEGGVTSMRCLNRLRLVRQAAVSIPGAEEFCARFDTIDQALATPRALPGHDIQADVPALRAVPGQTVPEREPTCGLVGDDVVLEAGGECCPGLAAYGKARAVRLLRITNEAACPSLGNVDAFISTATVARCAPCAGQLCVVCGCH
jgi:hypothetical protein